MKLRSVLVMTIVLLVACEPDAPDVVNESPFEEVFLERYLTELEQPEDAPIGSAGGAAWVGDYVILADRRQSNLKVFGIDGTLIRTVGRAGDGPGELRFPLAVVALDSGRFASVDVGRSQHIALWDTAGTLVRSWRIDGAPRSLDVTPRGTILLGGLVPSTEAGSRGPGARAQEFSLSGDRLNILGVLEPVSSRWEGMLRGVTARAVGDVVVSADYPTNRVWYRNMSTGVEGFFTIGDTWYTPIQWPPEFAGTMTTADRTTFRDLARSAHLLVGVRPVSATCLIAQFETWIEDARVWYYVVTSLQGETIAIAGPTPLNISDVRDASVLGTIQMDDGRVFMGSYELRARFLENC